MNKTILAAALVLAGLSTNAMAAELSGGFLRGEVGRSNVDVDGFDTDDDTSLLLGGGYYFNNNFAVEGFWANLYDDNDAELHGLGLGLVGKTNFANDNTGFYLTGRLGVMRARAEVLGDDATSTKPYFGVGAGYDFNENVGLGVNYTRFNGDFEGVDVDADTLAAAIEFRF